MSILRQRTTETVTVQDVGTEAGTENGSGLAFPTRVVLQPIAAPSVLGWFAFAGATFIVAAWMAGSVRGAGGRPRPIPRRYVVVQGPRHARHRDARNLGRILAGLGRVARRAGGAAASRCRQEASFDSTEGGGRMAAALRRGRFTEPGGLHLGGRARPYPCRGRRRPRRCLARRRG